MLFSVTEQGPLYHSVWHRAYSCMDPFLAEYLHAWPVGEERALEIPSWADPRNRGKVWDYIRQSRKAVVPTFSHFSVAHYVRNERPAPDPATVAIDRTPGTVFPWTVTGHFWHLTRSAAWRDAEAIEAMPADDRRRAQPLSRWLHEACKTLCGQGRLDTVRNALMAGLTDGTFSRKTPKYALRLVMRPELLSALLLVDPQFGPRITFTEIPANEQWDRLQRAFFRELAA